MDYIFNGRAMSKQQYDAAVRNAMTPYRPAPVTAPVNSPGAGSIPGTYDRAHGGIPDVPSLIDIYGQATAANRQMLPQFKDIGADISNYLQEQTLNNVRRGIPGWDAQQAQSMLNIGAKSRGEIPLDVRQKQARLSAERGVAGMTGGYDSPAANAALLRAYGLTSLDLTSEAEKEMTALQGRYPLAAPFDVSKLMMSPTDLYEQELLKRIYSSAGVPKDVAQQQIADQEAGYNLTRSGNMPGYGGGVQLPGGEPYTPIVRDYANPPALGATGPFSRVQGGAPNYNVTGNAYGGGGGGGGAGPGGGNVVWNGTGWVNVPSDFNFVQQPNASDLGIGYGALTDYSTWGSPSTSTTGTINDVPSDFNFGQGPVHPYYTGAPDNPYFRPGINPMLSPNFSGDYGGYPGEALELSQFNPSTDFASAIY